MKLVTLESALQAIAHIEQHNGDGRKREAVAMLKQAGAADLASPLAIIIKASDGQPDEIGQLTANFSKSPEELAAEVQALCQQSYELGRSDERDTRGKA